MKNSIIALFSAVLLAVCGPLALATSAGAYSVGATDVGVLDDLLFSANLASSGDQAEVDWINSVLGTSFTLGDMNKYDTNLSQWEPANEGGNVYVHYLSTAPAYFFIKTGKINGGGSSYLNDHFLFDNNASLNWAVLDLDTSFGEYYAISGIGKFSHEGDIGGTTVPEPTTLILLGGGLVALGVVRRKKVLAA